MRAVTRRPKRRQLGLFTTDGDDLMVGSVGGVHLAPRPATEAEVAEWLRARGYRVRKAGTRSQVRDPSERRRLAGQALQILELLQERGDRGAWNTELAAIGLKYTSRISEIRAHGYVIEVVESQADGRRRYAITGWPQ